MIKKLVLSLLPILVGTFFGTVKAQTCLECTSTTGINDGLSFCTTMTGNADDGTASPLSPTITGSVVLTTDRFNTTSSAYDFTNSATTKISYSGAGKLDVPAGQSFTMSVWFNQRDSSSGPSYIAVLSASNISSFGLWIGGTAHGSLNRKLLFEDYYAPSQISRAKIYTTTIIPLNTWNHAVGIVDKSTGFYSLYLNGSFVGSTPITNASVISSPTLYVGNNSVNAWGINGKVDDIRLYNKALSATEVYQLYSSSNPIFGPVTALPSNRKICIGDSVQLISKDTNSQSYSWSPLSDISNPYVASPKARPSSTTQYYLTVTKGLCSAKDSITIQVDTISPTISAGVDNSLCLGDSLNLSLSGGASSYFWTPTTGLNNPNIANPIASPTKTTDYIVKGVSGACSSYDTIRISVCVCSKTNIYDTITLFKIDTILFIDTIRTNIHDTIETHLYDTIFTTITDTTHILISDTILYTVTDTIHKTITDTVSIIIRDTVPIGVTDTLYIDIVKTGLNKPDNILNTIKVFPNPATDELVIDNGNYLQTPNYSLRITNSTGQTVFFNAFNRQVFRINTGTLGSAGLYFLEILDNNNNVIETRKVVLR